MATCNYTSIITESECIGDSLVTINNNFANLNTGLCNIISQYSTLGNQIAASLANLRISLSLTSPVITTDIKNAGTIHIHPYNGNAVGLYNSNTSQWDVKLLTGVLSFSLAGLAANTNYDIYLYHDGTNFQIDFTQWSSSSRNSTGPAKVLLNGAKVKQNFLNRRYIGCLRTTNAGQTEISFGRSWVLGGSHPKFFVWNAQNRVPTAYSIFEGQDWTVAGPGSGAANNNGPFSNFGYRSGSNQGIGNRVSFITGEPVEVEMHQDHWQSGGWAYLTHALDLEQTDSPFCVNIHRQGQFVSETQGQITHHSNFIVSEGYHYIQQLAMSYGGGTYEIFEGPVSGGDASFPGGRHSYGTTGRISGY